MMLIKTAEFIKSSTTLSDCPRGPYPEYAFIGRSNVGKSSLINMLTNFKKLAKTSASPGKTRLINHFLINNSWYLTDLPGFGFAKVPVAVKRKWEHMIMNYLLKRENLVCSFFLIDIRHEPLKNDMIFLEWMGKRQLPFCIIFTKADKLGSSTLNKNLQQYLKKLAFQWEPLPQYFISSSSDKRGREEILKFINDCNTDFKPVFI